MAPGIWDTASCYLLLPAAPCWIHILWDINNLWAPRSCHSGVFGSVLAVLVTRGVAAPLLRAAGQVLVTRQLPEHFTT